MHFCTYNCIFSFFIYIYNLSGESKTDIAEYLNTHGLRTAYGNKFTKDSITPIVQNTRYTGKYKYDGLEIVDENQRIVSDELFYNVQKRVRANQHTGMMTMAKDRFLLSGKVYCVYCQNTMTGESGTSQNGNRYHYYTCSGRKKLHICTHKRAKKEHLEKIVLNSIKQLLNSKQLINVIADAVMEIQSKSNKQTELINSLELQLKDTNRRIDNIMNAIEQGIISSTTQTRLKELESLRYNLEYEISEKQSSSCRFNKSQILSYFDNFNITNSITWQEQQLLVHHFINKIYLWEDKILVLFNFTSNTNIDTDSAAADIEKITKKIIDEQISCSSIKNFGSSSWARTNDPAVNSRMLCQLSY